MNFPKISKGEIYLVGGAVRDKLMASEIGTEHNDEDYVVIGATEESLRHDFPDGLWEVGKSFPVLKIKRNEKYIDISMGRKERKSGIGTRGFEVEFGPDVTLEEDLSRRDLTMNAMAMDKNGQLHDPFGGREDIKRRTLRHVTNAFKEDPLRVYRLARFAARFGFLVDPETTDLAHKIKHELFSLSSDRVILEFVKACKSHFPWRFLEVLEECCCKDVHFDNITSFASGDLAKAIIYGADEVLIAAIMLYSSKEAFDNLTKRLPLPNNYWSAACHLRQYFELHTSDMVGNDYVTLIDSLNRGSLGVHRILLMLDSMGIGFQRDRLYKAYTAYNKVSPVEIQARYIKADMVCPIGKDFGKLLREERAGKINEVLGII